MSNNVIKHEQFFPEKSKELENDYIYARENMYQLIETGMNGLTVISDIANQSQHPRAFEVFATVLKQISEMNMNLVELSKKKNEDVTVEDEVENKKNGTTVNQLFVGTTNDLKGFLDEMKNKKDE